MEVFNLVLKEQTTKKYFDGRVKELKEHMMSFILQLPRKLKRVKYMTPYEKVIV